jgi:hypothetical protein
VPSSRSKRFWNAFSPVMAETESGVTVITPRPLVAHRRARLSAGGSVPTCRRPFHRRDDWILA